MEAGSVEAIVTALNGNGVRYLVAEGLAVLAHGYVRFTADVDLIVDLEPVNLRQAMRALDDLLRLKEQAGRPQDRLDVEKLTALRRGSTNE